MPEDFAKQLNETPGNGWIKAMGLVIKSATIDEVVGEWVIGDQHRQAYGIVHGGVHTGMIETLSSIGAHLVATSRAQRAVGLENHTSFIRAVREGTLRGVATPVTRGRSSQVWETSIYDAEQKLVARGTVRLLCIPEDSSLAEAK